MNDLLTHCRTDKQRKILKSYIALGSGSKVAAKLNMSKSAVNDAIAQVKKYAAVQGYSPEHDMTHVVPDGFKVKGVSTYYDKDGKAAGQWVKSSADEEARRQMMLDVIDAMIVDLPKAVPRDKNEEGNADLMAVYPLGDAHIGMRAWGEECGEDWDLVIAEKMFVGGFDRVVKTAPRCKRAVIIDLGDWMHADNMSGTTERSGHTLDVDGRFGKMAYVAVKILRRMIESALDHHEQVEVICNIGNHNDTSAQLVSIALMNIYENEPRILVHPYAKPFHYITHGKSLIGTHHGHTCKADKLPLVMATDQALAWGASEHRYWYTGHIHHDTLKEYPGVKVESFRTMAGKDAYSVWNGYRASQDMKCIVHNLTDGEVERHTVNISMMK